MTKRTMEIRLADGLEATPIAMLVQVASQYESDIYMETEGKRVNAKSIMGMMSMGMDVGETLTVSADGADEEAALDGIEKYLSGN
ncbi:catabolite repression HPr-like protein [Lachnospiraceae bacterium XBB2008]|nr:HPr family phosphocarrier protein [Lachnospiraceae bacterium]MCR5511320.1 HPr family phosphocarrier protein [Lachnospiraceae bacterium]SCY27631.1 catabolite repression HPr-like protein [Lachnospiraceae bacterium XBB2008]